MAGKGHAKVTVRFVDGKPECDPEWVNLFWIDGPDNIKWVFKDVPDDVVRVDVEFLDKVPKKYRQIPGFLNHGPFRGMGFEPPTAGSRLDDIVTLGNTKEKGYFCYELYFKNADGDVKYRLDPGGTSDPEPPPGPTPPQGP